MKSCTLNDFMQELNPWLDKDHIREAFIDNKGHFVLMFNDGMKNVYDINDCNETQIMEVLNDLKRKGVNVH
ncbi:MAG: hypothetical protein KKG47_16515 [Proteobacteria bacterium]|nr:hypothetical protein [Pseudomonadota bacterium]MBU1739653.1 hypothetical protein [Pseudomonadota bacterium]